MGPQTALLCIDMRTKRTKKEILPEVCVRCMPGGLIFVEPNPLLVQQASGKCNVPFHLQSTYQVLRSLMLDVPQGVEHMVVLSGVPLIFPNASVLRSLARL